MAGIEKQLWTRVAITLMVVGGILIVGKWLPVYGVGGRELTNLLTVCSGNHGVGFWPLMYSCPSPMLLHQELGATALLGSVAIITYLALSIRRRLTN